MTFPWDLFPLMMQAVYVAAAIPALVKLAQMKRSDQRALSDHWMTLAAHGGMLAWAYLYANQMGMVASLLIASATTCASAALILHYRRWPGGRPATPSTGGSSSTNAPSRLHPARPAFVAIVG